jgi:hypothetical protein
MHFLIPLYLSLFSCPVFCLSRPSFFGYRESKPSILTSWALSPEEDALSQVLSEAFSPSFHQNPAYESAFAVFRALESKPSCHRFAAASLVFDCRSMQEGGDADQDLKLLYAAQLAVCEFQVAGIEFPNECRELNNVKVSKAQVSACARNLGGRPQWWTTLSNNMQNAAVMCSAVRHELETGKGLIHCL